MKRPTKRGPNFAEPLKAAYTPIVIEGLATTALRYRRSVSLVTNPPCLDPKKCGDRWRCHYCMTRLYGPDYWARRITTLDKV